MIDLLVQRLATVFSPANCARHGLVRWRVVFVDDGSSDRTAEMIRSHVASGFPAICLRFSRNFGHQPAVSAGLDHAAADAVSVMDADLQDPPEVIWDMLDRLREGCHVAYAQRRNRTDNPVKRLGCWVFYRLVSWLSEYPGAAGQRRFLPDAAASRAGDPGTSRASPFSPHPAGLGGFSPGGGGL